MMKDKKIYCYLTHIVLYYIMDKKAELSVKGSV